MSHEGNDHILDRVRDELWEITDSTRHPGGLVDIVAETRGEGNGWYEVAIGLSLADARHRLREEG